MRNDSCSCEKCEVSYAGNDPEIKRLLRIKRCMKNICQMIDKRVEEKYGKGKTNGV